MEKVSVRTFQLHATDCLKKLPLTLTRYGKDVAKVVPIEKPPGLGLEMKPEPIKRAVKRVQETTKADLCEHGFAKGLCKHGC